MSAKTAALISSSSGIACSSRRTTYRITGRSSCVVAGPDDASPATDELLRHVPVFGVPAEDGVGHKGFVHLPALQSLGRSRELDAGTDDDLIDDIVVDLGRDIAVSLAANGG